MKKSAICFVSLCAVLALLLAGCADVLGTPQIKGGVTITIADNTGGERTILPQGEPLEPFTSYKLTFTPQGNNSGSAFTTDVNPGGTTTVTLASGDWEITAEGFINGEAAAAGSYNLTGYTAENRDTSIVIRISMKMDENKSGELRLDNIPTDLIADASLKMYKYPNTAESEAVLDMDESQIASLSEGISQSAGYYWLEIIADLLDGSTFEFKDVVHIYPYYLTVIDIDDTDPPSQVNLVYELIDDGTAYRVRKGAVISGDVAIPPYYNGLPVTEIGSADDAYDAGAFYKCENITSVIIPDTVTSIGANAFSFCENLTSVTIPGSVVSISDYAFYCCTSLPEVTIPYGVISIGYGAFDACESLTSITISDSVTSIGNSAFDRCHNLTSITIPANVTSIGEGAFGFCKSLTSILVDEGNTAYTSENGILFNKDKTVLIQYPAGKSETSYTIPDGVTEIAGFAFEYCENLTSVTIPHTVTIKSCAFYGCFDLASITFEGNDVVIEEDMIFYDHNTLREVYAEGGAGTYTRTPGFENDNWAKDTRDPQDSYQITFNYGEDDGVQHGTVSTPDGSDRASGGETVFLSVKPEEGYELYGAYVWWHENGSYTEDDILPSADGTYSFTMPNADVTVTAIFHNPGAVYKISASSNAGGTVAVSTTEAKAGDSIAVTMEASDGYAISGFEITGAWIGRSGGSSDEKTLVHTFTMPPCDVAVSVTFAGEGTGGEDPQIPGAVYYLYSEEKTEFSRNTNTYTTWYRQADDNGYPVLDDDGHYAYYAGAEGTYSYTDTGVTLTPERGFFNTELFDRTGYETAARTYTTTIPQSELAALMEVVGSMGFATLDEYIDFFVAQEFAVRSYRYSFTDDGSLLMEEELPQITTPRQLNGVYTYSYVQDGEWVTSGTYTFSSDGSYQLSSEYKAEKGIFVADSEDPFVYLKPQSINNSLIMEAYYQQTVPSNHSFTSDAAYRAAQVNGEFQIDWMQYDSDIRRITYPGETESEGGGSNDPVQQYNINVSSYIKEGGEVR